MLENILCIRESFPTQQLPECSADRSERASIRLKTSQNRNIRTRRAN